MFGEYQHAVCSEDSSNSQTLSFPGAYSIKKKVIPLHQKVRHSKNTNRVLKPLHIAYTSPESTRNLNFSNSSQDNETFIDNSLGNIQEIPENYPEVNNLSSESRVRDPLEDLFPSEKLTFNGSEHDVSFYALSDCKTKSQIDINEIQEHEESLNMGETTSVINNIKKSDIHEGTGKQSDAMHSKIKLDIEKTPVCPIWNQSTINSIHKKKNDKENINVSTYPSRFIGSHDSRFILLGTPKQPTTLSSVMSSQMEKNKKKIEFETPNRAFVEARSVSAIMAPPPVPQTKLMQEQKLQNFLIINGKKYEIQCILGRGGSSKVYQVLDLETSYQLAVKEVDLYLGESSITQGYLQEIDLLRKLQGSESVIKMIDYEYIKEKEKLYVIMEKGETDLSKLIKEITKTKSMPISTIVHYWTEMLRAVKDIHAKNVIHSDLKPANFLLVCGRLKLIDFGIASSVQTDMTSVYKDVQTGTYNYISPEALETTCTNNSKNGFVRISYKSDIWSLGCILYNLLYGKTPFQHIVPHFAKFAVITNKNHLIEYPSTRKDCPPILLYAVKQCLTHDPKKRPTAGELLELPYFNLLAPESCLPG